MAIITNNTARPWILRFNAAEPIKLNKFESVTVADSTWHLALKNPANSILVTEGILSVTNYTDPGDPTITEINVDKSDFDRLGKFPIVTDSTGGYVPVLFENDSNSAFFNTRFVPTTELGSGGSTSTIYPATLTPGSDVILVPAVGQSWLAGRIVGDTWNLADYEQDNQFRNSRFWVKPDKSLSNNGSWEFINQTANNFLTTGDTDTSKRTPLLQVASLLEMCFPNIDIYFVWLAEGGANIASDFGPNSTNRRVYLDYIVNPAIENLTNAGLNVNVAPILIAFGAGDGTVEDQANAYQANMLDNSDSLITQIRDEIGVSNLPAYLMDLRDNWDTPFISTIKAANAAMALDPTISLIDTNNILDGNDNKHFSSYGTRQLAATYVSNVIRDGFSSVSDADAPTLQSAVVNTVSSDVVVLTYNETLDAGSVPGVNDFSVSGGKTVSNVSISGSTVSVTVNSDYVSGDTITISYTPGINPIQDVAENGAASLTNQPVTNNITGLQSMTMLFGSSIGSITESPVGTYTATGSATTNDWHMVSEYVLPAATDGYVQIPYTAGTILGFDSKPMMGGLLKATNIDYYVRGLDDSDGYRTRINGNSENLSGISPQSGDLIRIRRTGTTVFAEYSRNSGSDWTTIDSQTLTSIDTEQVYIKVVLNSSGDSVSNIQGSNVILNTTDTLTTLPLVSTGSPATVTESPAGTYTATGAGGINEWHMVGTQSIPSNGDGYVVIPYVDGVIVGIDPDSGVSSAPNTDFSVRGFSGDYRTRILSGSENLVGVTPQSGDLIRVSRFGTSVYIEYSRDNGDTFSVLEKRDSTTVDTEELYVKVILRTTGDAISSVQAFGLSNSIQDLSFRFGSSPSTITESPTGTYSATGSGSLYSWQMVADQVIPASTDGYIQIPYTPGTLIGFDSDESLPGVLGAGGINYYFWGLNDAEGFRVRVLNNTIIESNVTPQTGDLMRLRRNSTSVIAEYSRDNGNVWTEIDNQIVSELSTVKLYLKVAARASGDVLTDIKGFNTIVNVPDSLTALTLSSTGSPNTVTEAPTGTYTADSASGIYDWYLVANETIPDSTDGYIQFRQTQDGALVGMATGSGTDRFNTGPFTYYAWGLTDAYRVGINGSTAETLNGWTYDANDWLRLARRGTSVYAEVSKDNKSSWAKLDSRTIAAIDTEQLYIKFNLRDPGDAILNVEGFGIS